MLSRLTCICLFLAAGCSTSNLWRLDAISAGDAAFDSTRLRFSNPDSDSPVTFEMIKVGDQIESFLNLNQFRWGSEKNGTSVKGTFVIGEERFDEDLPLREGRMRLRLSSEMTERVILALQDGKKVSILIDGFEETLDPQQFARTYGRFLGKKALFQKILKGPFE